MSSHLHRRRRPVAKRYAWSGLVLLAVFAVLALAACGSSSGTATAASKAASAAGSSTTSKGTAAGSRSSRFAALSSCLQKQGITLPSFTHAAHSGSGSSSGTGEGRPSHPGFQLPKGVTASQLQAAMKKCGAGNFPAGGGSHFRGGSQSAAPSGEGPTANGEPATSGGPGGESPSSAG